MDEAKCAQLTALAQGCPVCERLIVAWATYHTADRANTSNVDFVSVLPIMCTWVETAAEDHPLLLGTCLEAAKVSVFMVYLIIYVFAVYVLQFFTLSVFTMWFKCSGHVDFSKLKINNILPFRFLFLL